MVTKSTSTKAPRVKKVRKVAPSSKAKVVEKKSADLKFAVEEKEKQVSDQPENKGADSPSVSHSDPKAASLVVDDRVLPDSGLPTEFVEGVLDIANEGSGLLRPTFRSSERDIYISGSQIRRFNLRIGDLVGGQARRPKENERYWGLLKVEKVNGIPIDEVGERPFFDDLVAVYPNEHIVLSTDKEILTSRVIDLISPIV
jgi:transcription termination factor Rho